MSSSATLMAYDEVFEKEFGKDFAIERPRADAGQSRRNAGADLVAKFRSGDLRIVADANVGTSSHGAPPAPLPTKRNDPIPRSAPPLLPRPVPTSRLDASPPALIEAAPRVALPPEPLVSVLQVEPLQPLAVASVAPKSFAKGMATAQEVDDIQAFIATNLPKFMPIYAAEVTGGRWRPAVCWPAVFAPVVWALYRKMYALAAFLMLAPVVLSMLHAPPDLIRASAASSWFLALYGRRHYIWSARRTIAEIRASASDDATAEEAIRRAGGVSPAGAVIGVLLTLCVLSAIRQSAIAH